MQIYPGNIFTLTADIVVKVSYSGGKSRQAPEKVWVNQWRHWGSHVVKVETAQVAKDM